MNTVWMIAGLASGCLLAACSSSNTADGSQVTPTESAAVQSREERIEFRRQLQKQKELERLAQDDSAPVSGEVPDDFLNKVFADLEQRTGGKQADFDVRRAESVQWNDGSLGCAEPGQAYHQVPVNGYWIVIDHQGKAYDYRASDRGYFTLCRDPSPPTQQIQDKKKGPRSGVAQTTEGANDFIGDKLDVVFVANFSDFLEVSFRRHNTATGILNRFQIYGGDGFGAFNLDSPFNFPGAFLAKISARITLFHKMTAIGICILNVPGTGNQRLENITKCGEAVNRERAHGSAVIGKIARNDFITTWLTNLVKVLAE